MYMSKQTFVLIYKSMVRSHLEYGNCVWSPTRIMDIEELERVQKRATIFFDKQIGYEERLKFTYLLSNIEELEAI